MWYALVRVEINNHRPLETEKIKYSHNSVWLTDEIKEAQKKQKSFS